MACYFSADDLALFAQTRRELERQYNALREKVIRHPYENAEARRFAEFGLTRRLRILRYAINEAFDALAPERDDRDIPHKDITLDAAAAVQSFVVHAFGCLENIAGIWVKEKGIKDPYGNELTPVRIGLYSKWVRPSFTGELAEVVGKHKDWFDDLKDFRDALAHRIPLYIPQYVIAPQSEVRYRELMGSLVQAAAAGDRESYDKIKLEMEGLGRYRPWMMHDNYENEPNRVFHKQLLDDYVVIDEIANTLIDELTRKPCIVERVIAKLR